MTGHKTAEQVESERVLLLAIDADTDEHGNWTVRGEPATAWQQRQIARAAPHEWERALDLMAAELDVVSNIVEREQRRAIRRANGIDEPEGDR
jgi:hypothetical protein